MCQLPYPLMLVLWLWISFADGTGLRVSDLLSVMTTVVVTIVMARYDFILPLFAMALVMTLLAMAGIFVIGVERLASRAAWRKALAAHPVAGADPSVG